MASLTAHFETGVNGNNVSAADAGNADAFTAVQISANAEVKYSNTHVHNGTLAMRARPITTPGSNFGDIQWAVSAITDHYGRFYIYPAAISNGDRCWQALTTASAPAASLAIYPSGIVKINDSSVSVVGTSTLGLSTTSYNRIEYHCIHSPTVGQFELKLFIGANVDGTTPDETITTAANKNFAADAQRFHLGCMENELGMDWWFDDIEVNNAVGYPGPYPTPSIATHQLALTGVGN